MQHLQVAVGAVVVADQAQPVGANRDGGAAADITGAVERGGAGAGARQVGAVGHLQVVVGAVGVADQAQPVGADRDGATAADSTGAVERDGGGAGAGCVRA